jgi:hypothetical protein
VELRAPVALFQPSSATAAWPLAALTVHAREAVFRNDVARIKLSKIRRAALSGCAARRAIVA